MSFHYYPEFTNTEDVKVEAELRDSNNKSISRGYVDVFIDGIYKKRMNINHAMETLNLGKLKIGNTEALSLYSPFLNLNGKEGTNIHYEYNNTQYTNGTLSRNMFYLSCLEDGVYILGDQNGISFSQQPYWPSDKKLKQEIKNIDTSWIDELKIKEFEYIKLPNKKQIGLIAQDYIDKDYSKYFLNENEEGYYGISYGNITNALIQYCQDMKKEINSLKEEIKQLKEENK